MLYPIHGNVLFPLIYDSNGQCNIITWKIATNDRKKIHFCPAESAQKHFKIVQNYYTDDTALYGFQVHSVLSSFHAQIYDDTLTL